MAKTFQMGSGPKGLSEAMVAIRERRPCLAEDCCKSWGRSLLLDPFHIHGEGLLRHRLLASAPPLSPKIDILT